jgi:drug/metabolite transporter (DMT)-like permease
MPQTEPRMPKPNPEPRDPSTNAAAAGGKDSFLAWSFVIVWGSGYLASKTGLQYAAPFTYLTLRFVFGLLCVIPWVLLSRPTWPSGRKAWFHLGVAGLLMHAVNLGGSHYAQYLGMSAGVTALVLATQPLLTAVFAHRVLGQRLAPQQWFGVALGLAGVLLVVWHKINVQAVALPSLAAAGISLIAITCGTLYQRTFCKNADLRSGTLIQFSISLLVLAPLAWGVEGFRVTWSIPLLVSIVFIVVFGSILAVNALHLLMRRGHATKVTSLFFLTPIVAVLLEWLMFRVEPGWLAAVGIALTCAGVVLVSARGGGRS